MNSDYSNDSADQVLPMKAQERVLVIAVVSYIGRGHFIPYHVSIGKVAQGAGYEYLVLVDESCESKLPTDWSRTLHGVFSLRTPGVGPLLRKFQFVELFRALRTSWQATRAFSESLRRATELRAAEFDKVVFFIERFNPLHIAGIGLTCGALRRRYGGHPHFGCWMIFNEAYIALQGGFRFFALRAAIRFLSWNLSQSGLGLLAYPETKGALAKRLGREFMTVPLLPSIDVFALPPRPPPVGGISCWYAGLPRKEKGASEIEAITRFFDPESSSNEKITLVLAESVSAIVPEGGVILRRVDNYLSEADYSKTLLNCHVLLMPYHPSLYADHGSNIFVEAIGAGRMPLVSSGTWLATQLSRYDLEQLVVDWKDPAFWGNVRRLVSDSSLWSRLEKMRKDYADIYSEKGFRPVMTTLIGKM